MGKRRFINELIMLCGVFSFACPTGAQLIAIAKVKSASPQFEDEIVYSLVLRNVGNEELFLKAPYAFNPGDSRTTVEVLMTRDGKTIVTVARVLTAGVIGPAPSSIHLRPFESTKPIFVRLPLTPSKKAAKHRGRGEAPPNPPGGYQLPEGKRYSGDPLPPGRYVIRLRYFFTKKQADLNNDKEWIGEAISNALRLKVEE